MLALALTVVLHQLDAGVEAPDPALEQSRAALDEMRELLRAIEHGLQEANDLGDTRAFDCVKTGQPAVAHQVESAEQWDALLRDAVANGDAALTARLLGRVTEAQREVRRRAAELSTCKLNNLEPPAPVQNRTWFGCVDAPASRANPAWRACERQRTSAVTFGLEGVLVALPIFAAAAVSARGVPIDSYGGLAVESAAGGVVGGLAFFAVSGVLALAISGGFLNESANRAGAAVGICTGLGVGAGALVAMWLDRPSSGRAAPWAAAVTYVVVAGISALIVALHDHFNVIGDEEQSLAEKSFTLAPALMAISAMVAVPAAWSLFETR